MSSFQQMSKHPETGVMEMALWIDDHFGRHRYGVQFSDGKVFPESRIESSESTGPGKCGVLFQSRSVIGPRDSDGCKLPKGHLGDHEFLDANGRKYAWATDLECDCEHCQSDDPDDWCVVYRMVD